MAEKTLIVQDGDRLDMLCFLAYGELGAVYMQFLNAQSKPLLEKGLLDAGDVVVFPEIEVEVAVDETERVWE